MVGDFEFLLLYPHFEFLLNFFKLGSSVTFRSIKQWASKNSIFKAILNYSIFLFLYFFENLLNSFPQISNFVFKIIKGKSQN